MADIEITTKPSKDPLSGNERVILHDPDAADKVAVTTLEYVAEYFVASGLLGAPNLTDLTINLNSVDVDVIEGTVVGTISGNNPRATLSVGPVGYYTLDGQNILKGTKTYSLAGAYPMSVTEALAGSPNSPHTTTASVVLTRDLTPTMGKKWSPDYFPELFLNIWVQEDLSEGAVAAHKARGIHAHTATQTNTAIRPVRAANNGGVEFAAQSARSLVIPAMGDGEKASRWALMTFRVDGSVGTSVPLYAVNDIFSSGGWLPQMGFEAPNRLRVRWRGQSGDSATWSFAANALVVDGATWNVGLTYRRNGTVHAVLNGIDAVAEPTNPNIPFTCAPQSVTGLIGTTAVNGVGWAYDVILQGTKELSDPIIRKLEGWAAHRRGAQGNLATDHPYRTAHPVIDADDFPDVYHFDATAWAASTAAASNAARFVNRGNPPPAESPMTVVFRDDFRAKSVVRSNAASGGAPGWHEIWFAPGHNTAVGVNATLNRVQDTPDCYIHDPIAQTMMLRLQHDGVASRWETGAFYSIDDAGTGRSWEGERVYEMGVTFPAAPVVGGLFPAFWGYALEHMFNRIGERIEIDFFEHDGQNQQWLNGLASHVHSGQLPGRLGHLAADAPSFKVCGYTLSVGNIGRVIDHWDGQMHVWQFRVQQDFSYLIVDGIECARIPTPREYLRRSYIIVDMAYRANLGAAVPGNVYDMVIDYIEVRQPTAKVSSFAAPFTARPTLSGTTQVDQVLTCDPKLPTGLTTDFWWYRSSYPIVGQRAATYTVSATDVGSTIRCMVKAVGATDQPEAWTAETAVVGGSAGASALVVDGNLLAADGEHLLVEGAV